MHSSKPPQIFTINNIRLVMFLGLLLVGFNLLLKIENMLLSAVLALVISYLLGPIVNKLERKGYQRGSSTLLVFISATLLLVAIGFWIAPLLKEQISNLKDDLPKYINGITLYFSEFEEKFEANFGHLFDFQMSTKLGAQLAGWTKSIFEDLPAFLSNSLTTLFLAPFLAFFIIKDGRNFTKGFLTITPNHIFELVLNLYHQINKQMGQFIRARVVEAAIVGGVTWIGLFMIDFPFATLLGIFAAFTNFIPYIGPIIGAIPALIIALTNGFSPFELSLVILVYGVAQAIDALLIIPIVVAKIVNLHPVAVILAIIIGAQWMGVLGMIISIPVASAIKVTLQSVYEHITYFKA